MSDFDDASAELAQAGADGEECTALVGDGWLVKIDRAADIFQGIEHEIARWNQAHEPYAPARVPWSGEPVLEVYRPELLGEVPFHLWEAAFNDGVHNLRAALDGMCWELAHLDGAVPERPKRIYFPMTDSESGWKDVPRDLAKGLSQEAFADQLGVHRTYMGGLERGERNLTLQSLERLAEEIGTDPRELLKG